MISEPREILSELVAFDTTSRNSNLHLIEWVEAFLARSGVASTRVTSPDGGKANLWATIGPKDVPGYVLSGHTDTVPVDEQVWASDPFTLSERDGRLYGRGAADMKGFLACVLSRVPAMAAANLVRPLHIAFSYDEEIGLIGARHLMPEIGRLAPTPPIACFVGEPTNMQVVVAHKGRYVYRGSVTGKPCHSSRAPDGVNAIDYAAELILKIRDIGRRLVAEGGTDDLYDVPFSTAHTGLISGGTAVNIVPEHCSFDFEFRPLPGVDHEPWLAEVVALARDELEPRMQAIDLDAGIEFVLDNGVPGFDTAIDSEAVTLAKRLAGRNDHAKVAYGTEAGLFVWEAGIPSVVIGPGSIAQAHAEDEFIEIAELSKCVGFLDRLIAHCSA
ncbi:MAG: acetylornithine deacetylase [Ancalomicrobiaceae bacterium]|nr:acetylornithine deacetylase [Ancalomicrobiaceae bacterium]